MPAGFKRLLNTTINDSEKTNEQKSKWMEILNKIPDIHLALIGSDGKFAELKTGIFKEYSGIKNIGELLQLKPTEEIDFMRRVFESLEANSSQEASFPTWLPNEQGKLIQLHFFPMISESSRLGDCCFVMAQDLTQTRLLKKQLKQKTIQAQFFELIYLGFLWEKEIREMTESNVERLSFHSTGKMLNTISLYHSWRDLAWVIEFFSVPVVSEMLEYFEENFKELLFSSPEVDAHLFAPRLKSLLGQVQEGFSKGFLDKGEAAVENWVSPYTGTQLIEKMKILLDKKKVTRIQGSANDIQIHWSVQDFDSNITHAEEMTLLLIRLIDTATHRFTTGIAGWKVHLSSLYSDEEKSHWVSFQLTAEINSEFSHWLKGIWHVESEVQNLSTKEMVAKLSEPHSVLMYQENYTSVADMAFSMAQLQNSGATVEITLNSEGQLEIVGTAPIKAQTTLPKLKLAS
jgi:hypothetical protein